MNKHNKLWFVASFFVLPLMLSACGGGDSPNLAPLVDGTLTPLVDGTNEGSVNNPVPLTAGTPRPSSVALITGVFIGSYYSFVATSNATAIILMSDVLLLLNANLYSSTSFTGPTIASCTTFTLNIGIRCTTSVPLVTGTRYYLRVTSVNPAADKFTLLVTQQ